MLPYPQRPALPRETDDRANSCRLTDAALDPQGFLSQPSRVMKKLLAPRREPFLSGTKAFSSRS